MLHLPNIAKVGSQLKKRRWAESRKLQEEIMKDGLPKKALCLSKFILRVKSPSVREIVHDESNNPVKDLRIGNATKSLFFIRERSIR